MKNDDAGVTEISMETARNHANRVCKQTSKQLHLQSVTSPGINWKRTDKRVSHQVLKFSWKLPQSKQMQGGGYITLDFHESKSSEFCHKAIIMNTQIIGIGLKGDTLVIDSEQCPQVSVQRVSRGSAKQKTS